MSIKEIDPLWGAHFLQAYSTGGLHMLHQTVRQETINDPKNVAKHPDFETWAHLIEAELSARKEPFVTITFP